MTRRLLNAALGFALSAALCGCWNQVKMEDGEGMKDYVVLPKGFRLALPAQVQQTPSNIIVTIVYERTDK